MVEEVIAGGTGGSGIVAYQGYAGGGQTSFAPEYDSAWCTWRCNGPDGADGTSAGGGDGGVGLPNSIYMHQQPLKVECRTRYWFRLL